MNPIELPQRLKNELAEQPSGESTVKIKHSVNLGDIVASLAAVKTYWEITGRRATFLQSLNMPAAYYPGAVHPTMDEQGVNVCVNEPMFNMMKPLVDAQPYIASFEKYAGQTYDLDFDVIRGKTFVNLPNGSIQSWIMYAFPDLAYDISKAWMEVPGDCPPNIKEQVDGKIILNFTERYRNDKIDYFFLQNYAPDIVFAGTEREHWLFCQRWQLNVPRLAINDFLDYAHAIKNCRFLLGNQSLGWNIAEAIKAPRILEVCQYAVNCLPFYGEHSYGFYHQVGVEYYFRRLYNKTAKK